MTDLIADDSALEPSLPPRVSLQDYRNALSKTFGFPDLREHQKLVLEAMGAGKDCLAVLPTGSGKSMCYVLPSLVTEGLTLVISPLVALMRDQVQRYKELNIGCAAFDSLQSPEEKKLVWDDLAQQKINLLYISPERFAHKEFRDRLKQSVKLSLVAVDEAHCISQWGNQFRPEYRKITQYLEDFPPTQKIALTATATAKVRADIIQGLRLVEPKLIYGEPFRENLKIKIMKFPKVEEQLTALLSAAKNINGQGIIYTSTRRSAQEITSMLNLAGESANTYHAGMHANDRNRNQNEFLNGHVRIAVATNAFGMGIDKRNIRFVFHAGMPASLEAYIQEIGRAGRDGEPANCYLFYSGRDMHIQRFLIDKSYPNHAAG